MNIKANQFIDYFSEITDPRLETKNRRYEFKEILTLVIVAAICGADNWAEIEAFGKARLKLLRALFPYKNGVPSHDTLGSIFSRLCPKEFQRCFLVWMNTIAAASNEAIMAIDIKALRRSYRNTYDGKSVIYMVDAWTSHNEETLAKYKKYQKSKKATPILELLQRLGLLDVY